MRFLSIIVALTAASFAAAAPSEKDSRANVSQGKCNGTSCKVHGFNFQCEKGSCVGAGGGDGKACFNHGSTFCPVNCRDKDCGVGQLG